MIREATKRDLAYILDIYNDAILYTTAVYAYKPVTLENRVDWYEQKKAEGYPIFVYELDNKVVEFATYSVEHSVYVDKAYRKNGIGSSLMKELIRIAKEREYMTLIAGIDAENEKSIALHQNYGFVHAGTIKKAGYKFNKWLDLAFYQLELNGPENPIEE